MTPPAPADAPAAAAAEAPAVPAGTINVQERPIGEIAGRALEISLAPNRLLQSSDGRLAIDLATDVLVLAARLVGARKLLARLLPLLEAAMEVDRRADQDNLYRLGRVLRSQEDTAPVNEEEFRTLEAIIERMKAGR